MLNSLLNALEKARRVLFPSIAFSMMLAAAAFSLGLAKTPNLMIVVFIFVGLGFLIGLVFAIKMIWDKDKVAFRIFRFALPAAVLSMFFTEENRLELFSSRGPITLLMLVIFWFGAMEIMRIGLKE